MKIAIPQGDQKTGITGLTALLGCLSTAAACAPPATQALNNATHRYVEMHANHGLAESCTLVPSLVRGINTHIGQLTCPAVCQGLGLEWQDPRL